MIFFGNKIKFYTTLFLVAFILGGCHRNAYPSNPYLNLKTKPSDQLIKESKKLQRQQLHDSKRLYKKQNSAN